MLMLGSLASQFHLANAILQMPDLVSAMLCLSLSATHAITLLNGHEPLNGTSSLQFWLKH
jgi:hypothetical protein